LPLFCQMMAKKYLMQRQMSIWMSTLRASKQVRLMVLCYSKQKEGQT